MSVGNDWFMTNTPQPDRYVMLSCGLAHPEPIAGHSVQEGLQHDAHLSGPAVAFGLVLACCGDGCMTRLIAVTAPLTEAARLSAVLGEFTNRHGLSASYGAASDQMRAWARDAGRIA